MKGLLKIFGGVVPFEIELDQVPVEAPPVQTPEPELDPTPEVSGLIASPVITTTPSFKGARVGEWLDVVETAAPFRAPRGMPFYMELQFDRVSRAHGLADEGETLKSRGELVQKYIKLYRDHGIEPIKQAIAGPYETDWDRRKEFGVSFRQLVLDGAIYAPCIFGPAPSQAPTPAYLKMIEAAIKSGELPNGSWAYVWDEPHSASDRAAALTRCKLIKEHAPSLVQKITLPWDAEFAPYVSVFFPVFEQWDGKSNGLYGSCMAQGSCTNGQVGTPTGTPMLGCVEADPVHPFAYPIVGYALGAKEMLYFSGTEAIETSDQPGGIYRFGGNGDGTIVYKNVRPSFRMHSLARGLGVVGRAMNDSAYAAKLRSLVKSPTVWSKVVSDYL